MTGILRRAREEAAAEWRLGAMAAALLFAFPLVGAMADVTLAQLDRSAMISVAREDSLIEWMQLTAFATASIFALLLSRRLARAGARRAAVAYLLFGLGCLFVTGEELDWGQRLLGYATPERLLEINESQITSAHNIRGVSGLFIAAQLGAGLCGSVGAWIVNWRFPGAGRLFVPPLFLTSSFLVVLVWRGIGPIVPNENLYSVIYGEWAELCLGYGLALLAALNWRRLDPSRPLAGRGDPVRVEDRLDVA